MYGLYVSLGPKRFALVVIDGHPMTVWVALGDAITTGCDYLSCGHWDIRRAACLIADTMAADTSVVPSTDRV